MRKKSLAFALAMIGFTATSGQIILVREFMVVFYGNELCLGLILANWLLWGAVGSWVLGRFADRIKGKGILAILEIMIAFMLPGLIFVARSARIMLKAQPGELIGLLPAIIFTFIILAPLCVALGFLFALGARLYPSPKGAKQIGYTYILEGAGASIGGLLTSLIMIRYLNSIHIAMIIGALNIAAAMSLRTFSGRRKIVKLAGRSVIAALFAVNIYLLIPEHLDSSENILSSLKADNLHRQSLLIQWGMLGLKTSTNSIYSNLTVVGSEGNYSFFSNGLSLFTVPNPAAAEQVVHFPMLEHPDPQNILLIGGGISGSLAEILKYQIKNLDYVELDPMLIELAQEWLDDKDLKPLSDPRVRIENMDGRLFIKRTQQKYDVVIIDLPEPFTAQLNRFYTQEFFREVREVLGDKGLLSLGVFSSSNYLSGEHQRFLNCVYKTLESVFPEIITIPADDQIIFMSCMSKGVLTYDQNILSDRLRNRKIKSLYVSEYQMPFWLEPWRVKSFSNRIREPKDVKINKDFKPVSYYYDMLLWTAQFSTGSLAKVQSKIFEAATHLNLWLFLLPAFLTGIILFIIGRRIQSIRHKYILIAVMLTGFAEIAFEVMASLAFQIIYGYMYYKLGLILTAFMIGLIAGSIIMTRAMDRLKDDLRAFILTQVAVCIYPLILMGSFWIFKEGRAYFLGANIIFPILPIIAGFIGGLQFPLATKIYLKHKTQVGRVAGVTYGVDLAGSCAGALLVSTFLIPILGIFSTCIAVVMLNLMALVLLLFE